MHIWDRYARRGLWLLPLWAVLLLLGTLTHQPNYRTDFAAYARYITTTPFLMSHLVASILGAGIGILGMVALTAVLAQGRTMRLAFWGLACSVGGGVLVTSVFGAAAYAQPAIGRAYLAGHVAEAIAINDDVYGPAVFAVALPGVLLFTAGIVLFGVAVARSGAFSRWAGIGFALGGMLFSPIGFIIDPVQTAGAGLLIVVTLWIALVAQRRPARDGRDDTPYRMQGLTEPSRS